MQALVAAPLLTPPFTLFDRRQLSSRVDRVPPPPHLTSPPLGRPWLHPSPAS